MDIIESEMLYILICFYFKPDFILNKIKRLLWLLNLIRNWANTRKKNSYS